MGVLSGLPALRVSESARVRDPKIRQLIEALRAVDQALLDPSNFEPAGTMTAHLASSDPHPTYTTATELATALAGYQPLDSDLTAIAALTTTAFGRSFLALADAAAGRTLLGLGTAALSASADFQPVDADLSAIAALTTTSFGRSFLTLADAAAGKTLLGITRNAGMAKLNANRTSVNYISGNYLDWDGTDPYDDGSWHDPATNNTRLTVPSGVDRVRLGWCLDLTGGSLGTAVNVFVFKNGFTTVPGSPDLDTRMGASTASFGQTSGPIPVSPGDYFEVYFICSVTINILAARSCFWAEAA